MKNSKSNITPIDNSFIESVLRDLLNVFQDLKSVYFDWDTEIDLFVVK